MVRVRHILVSVQRRSLDTSIVTGGCKSTEYFFSLMHKITDLCQEFPKTAVAGSLSHLPSYIHKPISYNTVRVSRSSGVLGSARDTAVSSVTSFRLVQMGRFWVWAGVLTSTMPSWRVTCIAAIGSEGTRACHLASKNKKEGRTLSLNCVSQKECSDQKQNWNKFYEKATIKP